MKKVLIWLLLFSICPFIFAQNLKVTQNTYEKVAISFASDTLMVDEFTVSEEVFSVISMKGYGFSYDPGAPQLPQLTKLLQVPVCDSVIVTVIDAQYTEYDAADLGIRHPLYPSQLSVPRNVVNPPFSYNQAIYTANEFYALPLVRVEQAGIRRDIALANVYVTPVQYNPVTERIRIYTRIDVEFSFVNINTKMTKDLEKYVSPMFALDTDWVVNKMKNEAKNEYKGAPIKYLIIGNSTFSTNTDLTAFVEWKRRLGYKVELAFTSDANVGTTTTSIKSFIQNKYNNATASDPAPTFLLLLGDVAQLPAFDSQFTSSSADNDHVTDLYYATLAGSDNIPDCYYGRLSATNNTQLSNQIAKILMYEQYSMPDPSYLGNAVLIAGTDGNGYSPTHADGQINYIYNNYVNTSSTTHQYTTVYKHNYNCSSQAATIRNEINAGVGLANYTAHGSSSGWADPAFSTSHVSSMTNANKYGLLIGNCCLSGKFDDSECFGEALLRAANKGAMAYIGASNSSYWNEDVYWAVGVRSSINASMSYDASKLGVYDKWFHTHGEAYTNWVSTIGGIIQGGNLSVQSSSSSRKQYYWEIYHCFGDPSVRVYLGMPNTMTVNAGDITVGDVQYTVTAVPYAYVALKKNTTEFIAAAFANASGVATLTLPSNLEPGTYELVALAQNYIWYHQNVEAIEAGSCISPSNFTVSNVTPYTANLSWTGESGVYNIQLKAGNGNWTSVASGVTATTYTLNGLQDDTEYQVRIQSVCGSETSGWRTQSFTTPVACPIPTELACTAFTVTTASLSWTENGSASSWTLQYGTSSTFASGYYTEINVSNTSVSLSSLITETTYYARVRANCGNTYGNSQWSNVCTFKPSNQVTECEDFESYSGTAYNVAGVLPTGWNVIFSGTSSAHSPHVATGIYNGDVISNGNGLCFTSGSSNYGTDNYAILPAYEGTLESITFEYRYESTSYGTLYLGYITDVNNANTFVTLQTVPVSTAQGTSVTYSLSELGIPEEARLAFKWSHNSSYYTCGIDNVCVTMNMSVNTCLSPRSLTAETTATSAVLNWTERGEASEWVLQYGTTSNFAVGTYSEVNVSNTSSTNLSGLTSETEYFARVKAVCDAENESAWSGICSFLPSAKRIIGSGSSTNNYLPTNNYYKYSLTQQIYTTEELGEAGNILSVDFYKNATIECKRNLDIYMVSTTKSSFTGSSDWITVTAADKVFSGMVNFADNEWTTITLNTAFGYDGTHNVVIIVDDNTGSYKSNTPFRTFSANSQAIRIYSDGTDYDAFSPSNYSGTIETTKNQIRILKNEPSPCPDPTEFSATACESYIWNGEPFTSSGDHTRTFTVNGCDSVVTLHLIINNPVHTATTETFCGSYTWTAGTGTTYYESGTYLHSHEDANGCTQVDTLHLTINNPVHTATTEVACESHTWNGTTYTESGDYTYSHQDAIGCTQVDTLHLTINNPVHTAITETVCGSYTWTTGTGITYTESGTYLHSHEDVNGCVQVDTLHLTINNPVHTAITEIACGSYTWTAGTGTTYTESGIYLHSHEDANGCTQVDTLHLTINNPVHTATVETACESYTWTAGTGTTYTESGTYYHSHEDANGCMQVDTLHLTINNPVHIAVTEVACENFTWNGTTYTESGDYTYSHQDVNGCTQVDTLHLTINNPVHTATTETACGSYTWTSGTGTTYTESGTYFHNHEDANGCTQVDTLHLTINNSVHTAITETFCGSYTWTAGNGNTYTESGTYFHSHADANGCIQVDTLHLTINNPVHTAVTETACGSYTWTAGNGTTYTESGTYLHSHDDANGCMQVDTLHLTINNPVHEVITETACGSYTWTSGTGTTYTESGTYLHSHNDANGCTQVDTLHLTINNPVHTAITETFCGSYTWTAGTGTTYTESGIYLHSHEDANGCTQVDTLHLTINNPVHTVTVETACESYTWTAGTGTTYTESGTYYHSHEDANGCTQVDTLHLTINNPVHTATTETACESYTWTAGTGTTYTESGTYLHSHEDANGCTQVDTLHLTINNPVHTALTEIACGSYTWTAGTGTTYYEGGTYLHSHQDANGCTQVDTLYLTINNPVHTAVTETACESFIWNNTTYTESGVYTYSHEDANGCTQVDTLHLTINNPVHTAITEIACGSYTWTAGSGTTYYESGTYLHSHEDANGCIQVDTLHLTINNPVHTATTEIACGSYTWTAGTGSTYTESGTYLHSYDDANGCTQVDTLHLIINNPVHTATTETACESFIWNGNTYTESGEYTYSHQDVNGCVQVDTLHLTINNPVHTATTETACGSYTWTAGTGTTYTESGTYLHSHEDANGCTQVDTLHLTINNPVHTVTVETACESYTWTAGTGTTYTESGTYYHSHEDANGCTQVDTLHLTINNPVHTATTETACESYTWTAGTGTTYTESGTYLHSHEDANGCTQVDTLHLTINNPVHIAVTEVACENFTWNGTTYTESGDYTYSHQDVNGCTQVDTLHLKINNPVYTATTETACGSYTWTSGTGTTYFESGTYLHSHEDANGCIQVDTLHLTINNPVHTAVTEVACESHTWNGTTYTESGDYTYSHQDANGCTQVDTLHLTINNPVHEVITETACGSYTWTSGTGTTYTESGTYFHNHEDANGCTQVDTLHLTINNPVHTPITETACGSYTWTAGTGNTYTESGTYLHSHEDANGCMQVDTLHLTINNPVHTAITETACESYTWTAGTGTTYTESGTYFHSHEDANGCTQVDTLHLTINSPVHTATIETSCVSYTWTAGTGTTYFESGIYLHSHEDANGCTQVDTLHLTINNPVHTAVTETVCESFIWNNTTYTESGVYTFSHEDVNGCTQIDTLHLTINNPVHTSVSEIACESFLWNNNTYTESGVYTFSHEDTNGCIQVDTLHLTINNPVHTATTETACGFYIWIAGNGNTYTESGTYLHSHEDVNGCVQVDTLHLTINNPVHAVTTEVACESYTWNGTTYTESGDYTYSHQDANGCTQVDTLHLTINNSVHTATTETACGSYTWTAGTGTTYTESGTYLHSHEDANGCTQVDTLYLTINNPVHTATTETACESYTWTAGTGTTYTESGTYIHSHEDVNGCTQVDTMHLTINNPLHTATTETACESYTWTTGTGTTYFESGTYFHSHEDANGCTQVDTLRLTINNPVHTATTETACGSYTWTAGTGITYFESGTYLHSHEDANGCTQVDTLHLTINNPVHTSITETACGSYTWTAGTGTTYFESGTYLHSHEDANGCTQVDTLYLTINNPVHTAVTETACESFIWNNTTYTESGTYLHSHEDANGCTQVDTLHLTINNPVHTAITETACGFYTWTAGTGTTYTESGTYLHSHEDANGCIQVDTLHLIINSPVHTATVETACGSYTWTAGTGTTYYESGTFFHSYEDANGCTQVDTLHLTINNPVHTAITETACGSYTWTAGTGTTYTESGTYFHSHEDANGCIQVDTLHLTINNPVHTSITETACGSYTWTTGTGTTYFESGTYFHSHEDANGCTQVDTLHLTINNPVHTATTETACGSYTWTAGTGITYTESGTYLHSHNDANGCTQVDTLYLTINNPVHTAITETACESYTWTAGTGITYTESGTYLHSHEDTNGCTQVDTLHLTINNPIHTAITETACGFYTWITGTGTTYYESGTYLHSHEDANGCTQVDTLYLTINNLIHTAITETACGFYTWITGTGTTYYESGTYLHSHEDANGCTQVDTLHLTINNPVHAAVTETACESFIWNNTTYTESGVYTFSHEDANGCTQVDTLHLTINNPVHTTTTETACGSYTWTAGTGTTYTESGTYYHSHEDANGCTQVDTLRLTINNPVHTVTAEVACENFTWNGTTFTESGDYTYSHQDVNGCTQVDTLHLTINHATFGDTTAVACDDFTWDGVTYTESGNYTSYRTNMAGCDSVVTLHLTVNASVSIEYYLTINENDLPYTYGDTTFMPGSVQTCDYTFYFTTADGCDSVIILHLTVETGINDYDMNASMMVYPNPTKDVVNVQLTMNNEREDDIDIQLFDMFGRLLYDVETHGHSSLQTTQIDLSHYAQGVYFVKAVSNGKTIAVRKVVKNR